MVSPAKMPSMSLPPLVRRKIFGSGRGGVKLSSRSTARGERMRTPWPPSPPIAFCQEKVVTSSLSQGRSCAKAAEVASQRVRPARSAAIQSPFGHAGAGGGAVPGEADVGVRADLREVGERAVVGASARRQSASFSCLVASVAQPWPKLSQTSMSTGRAPSIDHIAISKAPVSEAGTMPTR